MKLLTVGAPKRKPAAIFAALSIAVLSACSSGGGENGSENGANNSGAKESGATATAPTASEKEMLIVNEVSGVTFDQHFDKGTLDLAAGPFTDSINIDPPECSKLKDASRQISNLTAALGEFKDEKVVASVALTKQQDLYDQYADAAEGCSDVKMTTDGKQAAQEALKDQDLPPEAQEILGGMDFSAEYTIHTEKWDPDITTSPEKLTAEESSGSGKISGVKTELGGFRIMGVVNGVVVIVNTTPFADFGKVGDAGIAGQTGPEGITPEAKEAAKARAVEVFDAQAKKIMAAK